MNYLSSTLVLLLLYLFLLLPFLSWLIFYEFSLFLFSDVDLDVNISTLPF